MSFLYEAVRRALGDAPEAGRSVESGPPEDAAETISELWGVNAVMMQSPGSAGSTELARLNGVSGAHNDELLDESDTSSRGLFSGRKDLSSDSYDEDGNRKPSNPDLDLTQIPPHKRWSNVPMRYGYRVDNLQDANVFGKLSQDSWSWRTFFSYCGPGFLVAIAYLDPGNLEANLQAGAYTNYSLIWVLFGTCGIGLILQGMAARIGIVTGKHLAQLCRQEYNAPRWISLWVLSEISIVASDVQAVITSAIALKILFKLPLWVGCIVTACDALTFLSIHLLGIQSLELFFIVIVACMSVCFFWTFSMNTPNPVEIVSGFIPVVPSYGLHTAVGVIGSLILPQNYFVHSAVVLSRDIDRTKPKEVIAANKYLFVDAGVALGIAALINFAVISTFAEQFFNRDCATASTTSACIAENAHYQHEHYGNCTQSSNGATGFCQHIGLSDAYTPLRAALGSTAGLVWALGLLASGQSSTMTITYAGQFINEGFGQFHLPLYQRISLCRLVALVPAVMAAVFESTHPSSMDDATQIGNIIASICVPFAILPMLKFCISPRLMGEHTISAYTVVVVLLVTAFLLIINEMLFHETIMGLESVIYEGRVALSVSVNVIYLYLNYLMISEEVDMFVDSVLLYFGLRHRRKYFRGQDLTQNVDMDVTYSANAPVPDLPMHDGSSSGIQSDHFYYKT